MILGVLFYIMKQTNWITKKMESFSRPTQEMIARMQFGNGIENFKFVTKIVKEAKSEEEVIEKLNLLNLSLKIKENKSKTEKNGILVFNECEI